MCRKKRILISLLIICFVALSSLITLVLSGCAINKFNGKYIFGTANGEVNSYMAINGNSVTFVSKTDTAEFSYKSSGNEITLDTGVKMVFAEGGDVVYMPNKLQWSNGYTNSLSVFGPLRQRNGYFTQLFSIEKNGVVNSEIVFSNEGTFGMTTYSNNQIAGYSVGTYEFKSGLLTMNDNSSGIVEQLFFYVDENYNIYVTAGVKETSDLYTSDNNISDNNQGGNGDIDIPETPNVPDEPVTPPVQNYTLTYTAGAGGRIIGALSQTVESGNDGTSVIAMPDGGYEFIGWSDGVNTAERQDKNVIKNNNVTAYFERSERLVLNGSGTEDNPYQISSAYLLNKISEYPQAHFILTQDIVLNSVEDGKSNFTPMYSDDNMFNGVLDGDGHKIVNLTIYNTSTFYTGLFACIGENGCVKNLILENVNLKGTNYIGAVAGYSLGVIENCTVNGEINYLSENSYKVFIGGIVGRMENALDKCSSNVNISCSELNSEANVGGIAGCLIGGGTTNKPLILSECAAEGNLICESEIESSFFVGGLFGNAYSVIEIVDSYTTGDITAISNRSGVYAGGIVARCSSIRISNSYTTGDVTSTTSKNSVAYAGGFVGEGSGLTISNSYTTGEITVTSFEGSIAYAGGFVGIGSLTISNSYATGEITAIGDYTTWAGGFVGIGSLTISNSYTTGDVTSTTSKNRIACAGGFVGEGDLIISNSYTTGDITATSGGYQVYAGGFVGRGSGGLTISNSYTTGDITATGSMVYAGGFVGHGNSSINVTSSYTVSMINVTSEGTVYSGAFAGYTDSFTMKNAHWLYYADSGVEYAIGYGYSMGIPSSVGSTKHTDISDFYTLADMLNDGFDISVWENIGETSLPTLKYEEEY